MCGITGIFNFNSESVNEELLTKMTRLLSHRGPDDEGVYLGGRIGLGHRRLSIIDLSSSGHQPMSNEDGSIWITYNGEIYNHLLLRKENESKGHRYRSLTDTETIIHLYEEKGVKCLEDLDGEFAFCIWDANKKILFAARDRLGVKPFYYYRSDKNFIFASEIKAILLHPEVKRQPDTQALSHYLSFSVSPAPFTIFKDIFKLEAGHFLLVKDNGALIKEQYWDAIPKKKVNCTEQEAAGVIRAKLGDSIQERLMSDVPFGVFLSGGVDSSANAAFMSQMINNPVKTFNVAIEGNCAYDESSFAESVAGYFKTEHSSIRIKLSDFYGLFDDLAYYTDEPLCDYACIPNFYLAKLARKNKVPVIQVGEGADELFCGYRSYIAVLNLLRFYYSLPRLIKGNIFNLLKFLKGDSLHYAIEQAARNEEAFLGTSYLFTEKEKGLLFNKSINLAEYDSSYSYVSRIYRGLLNRFPQASSLDKMIYLDLKMRLPELLLMREDKMTMANSVEARLPYLDYQLVEYALSLPDAYKYRHNTSKYVFKKSLNGVLPRKIIFQSKKGFAGNPVNIFDQNFQNYVLETYKQTEPILAQWFDPESLKKRLIFNSKNISFREGSKVWAIFTLMLWMKRFLK